MDQAVWQTCLESRWVPLSGVRAQGLSSHRVNRPCCFLFPASLALLGMRGTEQGDSSQTAWLPMIPAGRLHPRTLYPKSRAPHPIMMK